MIRLLQDKRPHHGYVDLYVNPSDVMSIAPVAVNNASGRDSSENRSRITLRNGDSYDVTEYASVVAEKINAALPQPEPTPMPTPTPEPIIVAPAHPFEEFPKMARLSRECVITEKIDGSNGCIFIGDDGTFLIGSRTRWVTPSDDNLGFARWATEHRDELMKLGPGRHFGEWWGAGIQRRYGMTEKRFSLFNVIRWCLHDAEPQLVSKSPQGVEKFQDQLPACCGLVPVLYRGPFSTAACEQALASMAVGGSLAAPGFMKPEGIVCYHMAAGVGFKKTIEKDEVPKSLA